MKNKIISFLFLLVGFNTIIAQVPIGFWPLDGNLNDLSGNGRNGTLGGTVNNLTFGPNLLGEANKCAQFAEGVYINVGVIPDIRNDFSLSLMYKTLNPGTLNSNGEPTLIAIQPVGNYGILFEKQNFGGTQLEIYNADRWGWGATGINYVATNDWTHVVAVYNRIAGTLKLYQGGALSQTSMVSPNTILSNSVTLKMLIGARGTGGSELGKGEFFVGSLDNVRVYNVPLTDSEVIALYNSDIAPSSGTPPAAPLNLIATSITSAQIDLSWTASATATSYSVEYSLSNTFVSPTIINSITATSYSVNGLTASTLYYFRVKGTNASGSSGYSNTAQATTMAGGGGGGTQWAGSTSSTSGNIFRTGRVGIGGNGSSFTFPTTETEYNLLVTGGIKTNKIKVETTAWADYVFKKDYHLLPIKEVERFIKAHHHLPDFPSEASIIKDGGFEMGDMIKRQQVGIESLYLYIIELGKKVERMKAMEQNYKALEMRLLHIERKIQ